jgi:hypothetical protein
MIKRNISNERFVEVVHSVVPQSLRCPAGWVSVKVGPFTLRTNGIAWTAQETETGRAVMLDAVRCQYAGGKRSRARLRGLDLAGGGPG